MFVITGNGNGLGGFALAKANSMPATMRKAKNRAGQKLIYVERYNDHTGLCCSFLFYFVSFITSTIISFYILIKDINPTYLLILTVEGEVILNRSIRKNL